jgi:hypothetical protein
MPTVGLRWVNSFDIPTSCSVPVLAIALRVRRHHYVKMKVNRTHSTFDGSAGAPTQLPLPMPFDRWHLDSVLVLVVYLAVHVWHRRKRLWRSTIR